MRYFGKCRHCGTDIREAAEDPDSPGMTAGWVDVYGNLPCPSENAAGRDHDPLVPSVRAYGPDEEPGPPWSPAKQEPVG